MDHPHPRREPRFPYPLTLEHVEEVFRDCADFTRRPFFLNGDPQRQVTICFINGITRGERLNDYVLRPLTQDPALSQRSMGEVFELLEKGAIYNLGVQRRDSLDDVVQDLIGGNSALFFPGEYSVLTFFTSTEEKRSVGEPENEPAVKGARDSFVESYRTNTSLVRRRLRSPDLKIRSHIVGRQSYTPVDVVWLEGIADEEMVERVNARVARMDIDGIQSAGGLEEYLVDPWCSPFPRLPYTQRPDRFCQGLQNGRVGILCDGLPMGWLAPGTAAEFFQTGQDPAYHWLVASALRLVRYFCAGVTVLLPGLYIALVTFHPEAIPVKLATSIVAAKQDVPFSTIFEVLIMLLAFEVLQEAGLRLPAPIGATVSILGGLVVGNAAVEAHIVSPAVLIAVAIAGVAGYTQPSQDMAGALRLWRFGLAAAASVAGTFGLAVGCAGLIVHLAGLESFGVPYLAPFTAGARVGWRSPSLIRLPLPAMKWRNGAVKTRNRRNQR